MNQRRRPHVRQVHRLGARREFGLLVEQEGRPALYVDLQLLVSGDQIRVEFEISSSPGSLGTCLIRADGCETVQSNSLDHLGFGLWVLRVRPRAGMTWSDLSDPNDLRSECVELASPDRGTAEL